MIFLFVLASSCSGEEPAGKEMPAVYIKETETGFVMIRNGEPFYIKGAAGSGEYLQDLKEAGGNTIRVYDTLGLKKILDRAQNFGIAVVVDIPLPKFNKNFNYNQEYSDLVGRKIINTVKKFRSHPALLYWNLGNELEYPFFYTRTNYFSHFEHLVRSVKETDSNHPVSTAIIAGSRKRLLSFAIRDPGLDLYSLNSFGSLTRLGKSLNSISNIFSFPYVISEWGTNGHWEEENTSWHAPIENTGTSKAYILNERYQAPVLQNKRCLGSLIFYWGTKQERTSTWFSFFSPDGKRSFSYYQMQELWKVEDVAEFPPELNYITLDGKGAPLNIVLTPGDEVVAEAFFHGIPEQEASIAWEVKEEAWSEILKSPRRIPVKTKGISVDSFAFNAPLEEGPYRLYYKITTDEGFNSANIPFYVLNPGNEE